MSTFDWVTVRCPWCGEPVELGIALDDQGRSTRDCEVCCHAWVVTVTRDEWGDPQVEVEREA